MRYELVECNQFQANTFLYFNLGYEIKNGPQLCSKIDQNMFNAYSDKYIFPSQVCKKESKSGRCEKVNLKT